MSRRGEDAGAFAINRAQPIGGSRFGGGSLLVIQAMPCLRAADCPEPATDGAVGDAGGVTELVGLYFWIGRLILAVVGTQDMAEPVDRLT